MMRRIPGIAFVFALLCATLQAADDVKVDLSVQNPAIQKLQDRIAARAAKLDQWKNSGAVGEEITGLVSPRPVATQTLAEKKEIRDLVVAENEDRYALFREWVLANGLQVKDLSAIGDAFASSKRQSAGPAHWVQNPLNKEWVQKKDLRE